MPKHHQKEAIFKTGWRSVDYGSAPTKSVRFRYSQCPNSSKLINATRDSKKPTDWAATLTLEIKKLILKIQRDKVAMMEQNNATFTKMTLKFFQSLKGKVVDTIIRLYKSQEPPSHNISI